MTYIFKHIALLLLLPTLLTINTAQAGSYRSLGSDHATLALNDDPASQSQGSIIFLDRTEVWNLFAPPREDDAENLRQILSIMPETLLTSESRSGGPLPGWRKDGAPVVTIKPYPKASCGYWGFYMSIDNFEAKGSQSWKDCSGQVSKRCSGKYSGTVRWTKLPDFLEVGSKLKFDASVSTIVSNVCGSRNIDSGFIVRGPGGLYMDLVERVTPKKSMTITIPTGKLDQRIRFEVIAKTANLTGKAVYNYRYQ